jgi:hypothetical protein
VGGGRERGGEREREGERERGEKEERSEERRERQGERERKLKREKNEGFAFAPFEGFERFKKRASFREGVFLFAVLSE